MSQPEASDFKVVQVCSVAPLTITSTTTPTSLPLTFFDLLWLRFSPVERLYFYHFPHSSSSFFDSLLPNLKHSLSLTLQHFLPFAGSITWPLDSPKPIINYVPGDAVSFTVAESYENNFNHLCSHFCEAVKRHRLIPQLTISHEQASVLALQVTMFPNSGFCIGITIHHAAIDGKSSTLFMKSWAYACSKLRESQSLSSSLFLLPQHLTPFFDRSVIRDPSGIGEAYAEAWMNHGGPNNRSLKVWEMKNSTVSDAVKGLFELTPSHLQKLKEYGCSKMKMKVKLSTFSVTCAYVLACLVKAEQTEANSVVFIFSVDCRSRLDPPIPPMYIGNCIVGQRVSAVTKDVAGNDGFVSALEGICEALNRVKEGVLNGVENMVSNMLSSTEDRNYRLFSIAGSPRFEVYGIDFGWGRPKKVDVTSIDGMGIFSLSESRNHNGGVEIGLALSKREMEAFSTLFVQGLESF